MQSTCRSANGIDDVLIKVEWYASKCVCVIQLHAHTQLMIDKRQVDEYVGWESIILDSTQQAGQVDEFSTLRHMHVSRRDEQ